VTLSAEEWAALRPAEARAGFEWQLPEGVAREFVRALSPVTDTIYTPRPQDATLARLSARVESVEGGRARIRLTGRWETAHDRDGDGKHPVRESADADGVAVYDVRRKELESLLLVFSGTFRGVPPNDQPQGTAAVVEWRARDER
jgi:hypothetical protein